MDRVLTRKSLNGMWADAIQVALKHTLALLRSN